MLFKYNEEIPLRLYNISDCIENGQYYVIFNILI